MNTDIRLRLSFRNHPKTKKLKYKLGPEAVLSFIWLMMFVAESKPDGELDEMDETDIALAADWDGDAGEFVETLVAVRYLENRNGTYRIHNWRRNQPWAAGAEQRSEHGRKAAEARWKKEKGLKFDKQPAPTKNQQVTPKNHAPSKDGHAQCNAPIPIPIPIPLEATAQTSFDSELERRFEK